MYIKLGMILLLSLAGPTLASDSLRMTQAQSPPGGRVSAPAPAPAAVPGAGLVGLPQMITIPAGSFVMGSPKSEPGRLGSEGPTRRVEIGRFELARVPVTVGEFEAFVKSSGHATGDCWRTQFPQGANHPVVCVSWDDAQAYLKWLRQRTGDNRWRLPSEAEWEYAARAGTTGLRFWGDGESEACQFANVADQTRVVTLKDDRPAFPCRDGHVNTAPVGSFKANSWGLHDMLGNAWQWVDDCFVDSYAGAASDGRARTTPECDFRVLRGGSFLGGPWDIRSANRDRSWRGRGKYGSGFRLARTLP